MKIISTIVLSLMLVLSGYSQTEKRASPAKISEATVNDAKITVNYGSPYTKGRDIFGALVPYGKVWRTGANEATTLTITETGIINGTKLKAGTYSLFTIPGEKEWTIIINSHSEQWGAYNYDEKKDVMRFTTPRQELKNSVEGFTINVLENGSIEIMWDTTKVGFDLNF